MFPFCLVSFEAHSVWILLAKYIVFLVPYLINNYVIQTFKICTCFLLSLGFQPCRWCVGGCGEWVYLCLCVFICTLMARTQTPSALIGKCSDTELNPSLELISLFFFLNMYACQCFCHVYECPRRPEEMSAELTGHPTQHGG